MIYELCMTDRELSYEGHEERSAQVFSPNGFSEYDVNSHGDGTDVTESICFTSRHDAQQAMENLKKRCDRQRDECLWQEGFERV